MTGENLKSDSCSENWLQLVPRDVGLMYYVKANDLVEFMKGLLITNDTHNVMPVSFQVASMLDSFEMEGHKAWIACFDPCFFE